MPSIYYVLAKVTFSYFCIIFYLRLFFFYSQKPFPLTIPHRKTWLILTILSLVCQLQFPVLQLFVKGG